MRRPLVPLLLLLLLAAVSWSEPKAVTGPQYDARGELVRPRGFRSWVVVGTSLGLGYSDATRAPGDPGPFRSVYMEPSAFAAYRETGEFPEGTMLALIVHGAGSRTPPAKNGFHMGEFERFELAVKDSSKHADGWAYYDFGRAGELKETSTPFERNACFACHAEHAAEDNVFVQFYPVLRDPADDE